MKDAQAKSKEIYAEKKKFVGLFRCLSPFLKWFREKGIRLGRQSGVRRWLVF